MRKLLPLILLVILCNISFAQTDTVAMQHKIDSLYKDFGVQYSKKDYKKALSLLLEVLPLSEKISSDAEHSDLLSGLGTMYFYIGDVQNSLKYYKLAADLQEKLLDSKHSDYIESLNSIGLIYYYTGEYEKALEYYLKALEIQKMFAGEENAAYANSLNNIGILYSEMGKYNKALEYKLQALEILNKYTSENTVDYANMLNNVGLSYSETGDYKNAMECYNKAAEIQKKLLGTEHQSYATTLNNIGTLLYRTDDYHNALKYFLQSAEILKKALGDEHSDYLTALNNIGLICSEKGDYQNAMKFYTQVLEIRKKTLGKTHPDYAATLNNIAALYSNMGDCNDALTFAIQALEIQGKALGKNHPEYATSLNNIGSLYSCLGDYGNAMKYKLQALEIEKNVLGETNQNYIATLDNIGVLCSDMGDYPNALKYYIQALEIREKGIDNGSISHANLMNNIAALCSENGEYPTALQFYLQALEIWKKVLGVEHPNYATTLDNIASLYYLTGDYQNALNYRKQAIEIKKKALGENHPDYATTLGNMGVLYSKMNDIPNALKCNQQALEIKEKVLGLEHPDIALTLSNIAALYYENGDYQNAINTNSIANNIRKTNIIRNFSFMTTHEREAYWNVNNFNFSRSILYSYRCSNDTLAAKISYDTELITKGLLLASEISLTKIIKESGNGTLISEFETMKTMHLQLNKELERPVADRIYNCDSLENEIQKLERHIVESSKEFGDITNFIRIDWKDVQKSLKNNDVAIEFTNIALTKDSTVYAAIILTKNMESPVFVPLFEQKEIARLLRGIAPAKPETPSDDENRGATSFSSKRLGIYESTGLYNMIWKPLEKYFPDNPRIYFAPSGMLHQIAVEYAPIDHEQIISDKYEIYRVSSTRFLAMDYIPNPMKNSVLYGGIFYDSDSTTMKRESDRYPSRSTSYSSFASFNKGEDRGSLSYLPGTKTEVENIVGKMKNNRIKSTLYEGSQANEESFKALSGKDISILHIATHGFFLPTDEKLSGDQSLVQSGLLFSGANYAWQNLTVPDGVEDGILTAKEISFLDLRKTDLVVLSACQTALGEISDEGVFGLQRGFKKAGVRTIIMSLWSVDDNATLLMMTDFYSNLTKGMTKREAFLAAQNKVKNTADFENPRYWAAFIMLDGNGN
ncbi:MAG: CHAT domain-containing protein [Bacteroidales bacterium]|nr:CHAT domain-containing protein [Bacteroidales bacterium]